MSDVPIRYSRRMRRKISQIKPPKDFLSTLDALTNFVDPELFSPDLPGINEFTTGESMGSSSDRLAAKFLVSREEQDKFAVMSHTNASQAQINSHLSDVKPVTVEGILGGSLLFLEIPSDKFLIFCRVLRKKSANFKTKTAKN